MFRFDTPPSLRLSRGELMTWQQAHSVRLRVQSGLLWVTRENDLDDHFLRPGDSLLLPRGVTTLIGAEDEAGLCFEQVRTRSPGVSSRLWLWLSMRWLRTRQRALPTGRRPVLQHGTATVIG